MTGQPMLQVRDLTLSLPDRSRGRLFAPPPMIDILHGISLDLARGQSLGIVGESGSGKTSLGRALVRLHRPTSGQVVFEGTDITALGEEALRPLRKHMQMIFQDPQSSLNPRRRIGDIVAQPVMALGVESDRRAARKRADRALDRVGLGHAFADRFPHELSGGQRQRVGIARAIATEPRLIVADEIVSGLDVSTQAQILALLNELKQEMGLSLVFISHDLSVVRVLADRVMVMLGGRVVEEGEAADVFQGPRHAYTRQLIDAVPLPVIDPGWLDSQPDTEGTRMVDIKGQTVLVTGTSRGIGKVFVEALLAAGAAKVYAATRNGEGSHGDDRVVPVKLDVTSAADIAAAVQTCADTTVLINNAGVNFNTKLLETDQPDAAAAEITTNYLGTLNMCRAFAPVIEGNGGGAIVNMASILARVNLPLMGSLCASKAAVYSMTQGIRAELAAKGIAVFAVLPGAVDTDMTKDFPPPKAAPADIVAEVLAGMKAGEADIYPGDMARGVSGGLAADRPAVIAEMAGYV
jgi:peptide/nickel transport system ATP-binding protein